MSRFLKTTEAGALAFVLMLIAAGHLYKPASAVAAGTEREVQVPEEVRNVPVVITMVALNGAKVQAGRFNRDRAAGPMPITPFQAGDDWIQSLTIHLLNRTSRTIVYAEITLGFPETGDGFAQAQRSVILRLGRKPDNVSLDPVGGPAPQPPDRMPLSFGAGKTLVVALRDYMGQIAAGAGPSLPPATATKLRINLTAFYFPTGMRFIAGGYSAPDSEHPGTWLFLGRDYFPGDMDANWPGRPGWVDSR